MKALMDELLGAMGALQGTASDPVDQMVLALVLNERRRASVQHPRPLNSPHEGYAVIKEELDEVWDAVRSNNRIAAVAEAIQVAAVAMRFAIELMPLEPKG